MALSDSQGFSPPGFGLRGEEIACPPHKGSRRMAPDGAEPAGYESVHEEQLHFSVFEYTDFLVDGVSGIVHGNFQVVVHLQSEPELCRSAEITGKTESRIG